MSTVWELGLRGVPGPARAARGVSAPVASPGSGVPRPRPPAPGEVLFVPVSNTSRVYCPVLYTTGRETSESEVVLRPYVRPARGTSARFV